MQPDGVVGATAGVAIVLIAYGALFGGAELLRRRGIGGESTRTIVHVSSGFLALGLPSLFDSPWPVALMAIAFAGAMVTSRDLGLLGSIHDVARPTVGAPLYPVGIAAAFALTGGHAPGYPVAVLALGLGDPAASLAGRRLARRFASVRGSARSVEGTLCACLVTAAATAAVLVVSGGSDAPPVLATSIAVGVGVALVEAASPGGSDNLTIPLAAVAILAAAGRPWWVAALLVLFVAVTLAGVSWRRPLLAGPARGMGPVP